MTKKNIPNGRAATKRPTIQERVAEMVRLATLFKNDHEGKKSKRQMTPLEEVQHSVSAWEMWSAWEKARQCFYVGNPDHIAVVMPVLLALIEPDEPEISRLFQGSLAGTNLRSARAQLRDVLRLGITDNHEYFRWQLRQQAARNILRRHRGEIVTVDWEDDSLSKLGIKAGDEIKVVQTLDIQSGDLVCYDRPAWFGGEPDGAWDMGVLRIEAPFLSFARSRQEKGEWTDLHEIKFVGRAVAVHRAGQPADVPFAFRPYEGEA